MPKIDKPIVGCTSDRDEAPRDFEQEVHREDIRGVIAAAKKLEDHYAEQKYIDELKDNADEAIKRKLG